MQIQRAGKIPLGGDCEEKEELFDAVEVRSKHFKESLFLSKAGVGEKRETLMKLKPLVLSKKRTELRLGFWAVREEEGDSECIILDKP